MLYSSVMFKLVSNKGTLLQLLVRYLSMWQLCGMRWILTVKEPTKGELNRPKKEYLRQLASYRATLVSKGNTLESPYNGKGLADVTKVGEPDSRSPYLMNPRMNESSGY